MKLFQNLISILYASTLLFCSCSAPKYFHDEGSLNRQKELKNTRAANIITDIAGGIISTVSSVAIETETDWSPTERNFKKMKLINPTKDTIYVNMLTDIFWDKEDYCDFMDIRIPPKSKCKILVPLDANYNLFFSNTSQKDDDEVLEIYTTSIKNIWLYPGIITNIDKEKIE